MQSSSILSRNPLQYTARARAVLCTLTVALILTGCGKQVQTAHQPPPPPPPAVVASLTVEPTTVDVGATAVVKWVTQNAVSVQIEPIGEVNSSGSASVTPTVSTTYKLIAKGPGGTQELSARLTVNARPSPADVAEETLSSALGDRLDVFFDTDQFSIRADQEPTVKADATFLREHPDIDVRIEGHCDELGSTEYNLALGESRASEVKSALAKAGISPSRIEVATFGKERPFCSENSEACWEKNRRAHVVTVKP